MSSACHPGVSAVTSRWAASVVAARRARCCRPAGAEPSSGNVRHPDFPPTPFSRRREGLQVTDHTLAATRLASAGCARIQPLVLPFALRPMCAMPLATLSDESRRDLLEIFDDREGMLPNPCARTARSSRMEKNRTPIRKYPRNFAAGRAPGLPQRHYKCNGNIPAARKSTQRKCLLQETA